MKKAIIFLLVFVFLASLVSATCTDSDGINFAVQGTTVIDGITYKDYCESPYLLIEYVCGGDNILTEKTSTSTICENGKIVSKDRDIGDWIVEFFNWVVGGIMKFLFGDGLDSGSIFAKYGLVGLVGAGIGSLVGNVLATAPVQAVKTLLSDIPFIGNLVNSNSWIIIIGVIIVLVVFWKPIYKFVRKILKI